MLCKLNVIFALKKYFFSEHFGFTVFRLGMFNLYHLIKLGKIIYIIRLALCKPDLVKP